MAEIGARLNSQKKVKEAAVPERPVSAYMLRLNGHREPIRSKNPGISVRNISKKAGEMWKHLTRDRKKERERKGEEAKKP